MQRASSMRMQDALWVTILTPLSDTAKRVSSAGHSSILVRHCQTSILVRHAPVGVLNRFWSDTIQSVCLCGAMTSNHLCSTVCKYHKAIITRADDAWFSVNNYL